MVKKLLKMFSIFLLIALVFAGFFFYSIFVSVGRLNIDYGTLSSEKISPDLNGVSIAFFSDIHYGTFMNEERLTTMIEKINNSHPDILVFVGDIFDHPEISMPDEQSVQLVTTLMSSLDAPLGKFAVLGDQDQTNDDIKAVVKNVLYQSDFELLNNQSIRLRNQTNASVSLIGVEPLINGTPDFTTAYSNVNAEEYNILISHCPDIASSTTLPLTSTDVIVSGHSLGGQVYIPLIGPLFSMDGAKRYNHGSYTINTTKLVITNGLGTMDMDMRLFAPPQLTYYRLQSITPIVK